MSKNADFFNQTRLNSGSHRTFYLENISNASNEMQKKVTFAVILFFQRGWIWQYMHAWVYKWIKNHLSALNTWSAKNILKYRYHCALFFHIENLAQSCPRFLSTTDLAFAEIWYLKWYLKGYQNILYQFLNMF